MIDLLAEASADELNLLAEENADLTGGIQSLTALREDLADVLAAQDAESVFWVQRATGPEPLAEAWAAPLKVGPFLAKHLYEAKSSVVFCSATLSVGGRFAYIGERLGLDAIAPERLATCLAPSPFDYARQCTLLAPAYLPDPTAADRSYVTELAILICQVAAGLKGRTLCLFTSYDMLRQCARLAEPALQAEGISLLVHGESGSRDLLLRTFRQGGRCILFGTHSFWEGVDVVGEALSCVILARLPFASPGDPVLSARCEQLDREGKPSFRALSLPAAVLRLRQGFGRLIRHRSDRGLVIVADTRMLTKPYGATFRRNLPCAVQVCGATEELLDHLTSYAIPGTPPGSRRDG
jgi:ATP-dependent DNA helicase DinG